MNHKQLKYENPERLEELNPLHTLQRIGLRENHVLCDIGAGSGIFSIPAAQYTKNTVFALEKDNEMLNIIDQKASQNGVVNIRLLEVLDDYLNIDDKIADVALMVTVLHEIDNKSIILEEVRRILKPDGKFAVIEFHKHQTSKGPPITHRISKEEMEKLLIKKGFFIQDTFDLGANFYCMVFGK